MIKSLSSLLKCSSPLARQGAFRCFASLGANDEDIRKRIIETDELMEEVLAGLGDSCPEVKILIILIYSIFNNKIYLYVIFYNN